MAEEYIIDGTRITSLAAFYEEISRVLIPGATWGRNLDALDDVLGGGFGTPPEGFTIKWCNAHFSKENLGYAETVRFLEEQSGRCHANNRESVRIELESARARTGPTLYDRIIEIIRSHGPGGDQADHNVSLVLD